MTAITTTTVGTTHIDQLNAPETPTNAFDAILFGNNNHVAAIGDETNDIIGTGDARVGPFVQVEDTYPKKSDTDGRNQGAGAEVWTWKFVLPAGTPFVASNVGVTNFGGGTAPTSATAMLVSGKVTTPQRYDERLIVWINVAAGGSYDSTIYTATEDSFENRVTRVVGFTARNRALDSYPNGSVMDSVRVRTRPQPGQQVWTAAMLAGMQGTSLTVGDVQQFDLYVELYDADNRSWIGLESYGIDPLRHVYGSPRFGDQRWNRQSGYNVAHAWTPPAGYDEPTFRLTYTMLLTDGDQRQYINEVEVR